MLNGEPWPQTKCSLYFQYESTRKMLVPATLLGLVYAAIINSNQDFMVASGFLLLSGIIGATGELLVNHDHIIINVFQFWK